MHSIQNKCKENRLLMNEHNFSVITLVIILFQNKAEFSSILKEIFGDDEEVDAREQDDNTMCDDEGSADATGFCLWNEPQCVNICFQYSNMKT